MKIRRLELLTPLLILTIAIRILQSNLSNVRLTMGAMIDFTTLEIDSNIDDTKAYHLRTHGILKRLINRKTIMAMRHNKCDFCLFQKKLRSNIYKIHNRLNITSYFLDKLSDRTEFSIDTPYVDVSDGEANNYFCRFIQIFRATGCSKKHILVGSFNENFGLFSTYVINRTINRVTMNVSWDNHGRLVMGAPFGAPSCGGPYSIDQYLRNSNVGGIITSQHQAFKHPKVFSIPLGIKEHKVDVLLNHMQSPIVPKTQLLMLNFQVRAMREEPLKIILKNFPNLTNTFDDKTISLDYYQQIQSSKFVLTPTGMGWDSYRIWETLYMGAFPIIEHFNRTSVDGWFRVLEELPVLLVDTYAQITPQFLEDQYLRLVSKTYNWDRMTIGYWVELVESMVPK